MKYWNIIPLLVIFLTMNLFSLELKWVDEGILVDRDRDKALEAYSKKNYRQTIIHMQKMLEFAKERQNIASGMLAIAESRVRMGSVGNAVIIYRDLVDNYPKYIPFLEVLQQEYVIAKNYYHGQKRYSIFSMNGKAVKLYAHVIQKAPQSNLAAQAIFHTAEIKREQEEYQLAVVNYERLLTKFPDHKYCQNARFQMIGALITLAREADGDGKLIKRARYEINLFRNLYPEEKEDLKVLDEYDKEAREVEAERLYRLVEFYLRKAHYRPEASKRYLDQLFKDYKDTEAYAKGEEIKKRLN